MSDTTILINPSSKTLICSVLFLDIVEYSKKSVSGQIKLKDRFNALLSQAIADIEPTDRIILDTGDGAAISFLGDPEEALAVALRLRTALLAENEPELPLLVRIGINLGPVKLVKDINGQPNIIGDGINVAQRVMSFAEPGQVLISRSYYDVVSRMSHEYAQMFEYLGSHTDKHVREHEIYIFVPADQKPGVATSRTMALLSHAEPGTAMQATGSFLGNIWQNKTVAYAVGGVAVLLIVIFSLLPRKPAEDRLAQAPAAATPAEADKKADTAAPAKKPAPSPGTAKKAAASGKIYKPSAPAEPQTSQPVSEATPAILVAPGYVGLAITPWGEVFVDGKYQGVSPPLKELPLAPGTHQIQVKNTTFPPFQETIELKANGRVKIKHKFTQ